MTPRLLRKALDPAAWTRRISKIRSETQPRSESTKSRLSWIGGGAASRLIFSPIATPNSQRFWRTRKTTAHTTRTSSPAGFSRRAIRVGSLSFPCWTSRPSDSTGLDSFPTN